MQGDNFDPLPMQLAELLAATIQVRLMFEGFRKHIPEGAVTEFLPIVQRLFDIEIQLRELNIRHRISAATSSELMARGQTIH